MQVNEILWWLMCNIIEYCVMVGKYVCVLKWYYDGVNCLVIILLLMTWEAVCVY